MAQRSRFCLKVILTSARQRRRCVRPGGAEYEIDLSEHNANSFRQNSTTSSGTHAGSVDDRPALPGVAAPPIVSAPPT
jgi:hypothetical protein